MNKWTQTPQQMKPTDVSHGCIFPWNKNTLGLGLVVCLQRTSINLHLILWEFSASTELVLTGLSAQYMTYYCAVFYNDCLPKTDISQVSFLEKPSFLCISRPFLTQNTHAFFEETNVVLDFSSAVVTSDNAVKWLGLVCKGFQGCIPGNCTWEYCSQIVNFGREQVCFPSGHKWVFSLLKCLLCFNVFILKEMKEGWIRSRCIARTKGRLEQSICLPQAFLHCFSVDEAPKVTYTKPINEIIGKIM